MSAQIYRLGRCMVLQGKMKSDLLMFVFSEVVLVGNLYIINKKEG